MNDPARRWPLVAVLLLIGLATLVPLGSAPPRYFTGFDWSDLLVNVVLYLPLGFLLARAKLTPLASAAIVLLLSGAIEALQATVITGRRGSPVDVATNFLGAMAGVGCYVLLARPAALRSRSMIAGSVLVLGLPALGWLLSGWLLTPTPPRTARWWGQWAHEFLGTEPFKGTILSVAMLGRGIPDDQIPETAQLQDETRERGFELEVKLISGGRAEGPTHLASVADGQGNGVIGLEQLGEDLLLGWYSKGATLGLRPPQLVFAGVLRARAGDTVTVRAAVQGAQVRVGGQRGRGAEGQWQMRRWLTPLTGWRNFIPSKDLSAGAQRGFDAVWTLLLAAYLLLAWRLVRGER